MLRVIDAAGLLDDGDAGHGWPPLSCGVDREMAGQPLHDIYPRRARRWRPARGPRARAAPVTTG